MRGVRPRLLDKHGWQARVVLAASVLTVVLVAEAVVMAQDRSSSDSESVPTRVASLAVTPSSAEIRGRLATQQLIVTATDPEGAEFDVTRAVSFRAQDRSVATVEPGGWVRPVTDADTVIVAEYGSHTATCRVSVRGTREVAPIHFTNDIVPVLTKSGCNAGGCHGKASGQNGFKLSLLGFDPAADYDALVKEARGRRVFPAAPERSLLVLKATGQVPHGGGVRIPIGSAAHGLLVEWVRQGLPTGRADAPRVVGVEAYPAERVLRPGARQQLIATAVYSDGSRRDVTHEADFASNVSALADVNEHGLITTGAIPGEAAIMVRYMGQVGVSLVILPRPGSVAQFPPRPHGNVIDGLVWDKLRKLNIAPSGPCDDATFLRRAYIDTIGTIPSADEVRRFLSDSRPDRRARLVDELLERSEFNDYWALRWADILRVDSNLLGRKGAYVFHEWLRSAMASRTPLDRTVREIVLGQGNTHDSGPANLYRAVTTPEDLANTVSQAFLGVRIQCAQCHHHPFERWGQDDFYGLAAYFTGVQRRPGPRKSQWIHVDAGGTIKHPRTGAVVPAHPLEAGVRDQASGVREESQPSRLTPDSRSLTPDADRRAELADWLTSPDNPWFARMLANRVWGHFLGRGLVEPLDDMRVTNPPTNQPLLDALARYIVEAEFDLRSLIRVVLNSETYQRSAVPSETNGADEQNYSHAMVKRIPAEVLLDGLSAATESSEKFVGVPLGPRAVELWDNRLPSYFLAVFGRPMRASPCECERSTEPSMSQALHLMNSPEINRKIADRNGRVARLVRSAATDDAIIEELYLVTVSRFPTTDERSAALAALHERAGDRQQAVEDLLWALMNSRAFFFNR